jgi:hypothetical protein
MVVDETLNLKGYTTQWLHPYYNQLVDETLNLKGYTTAGSGAPV